MTEPREKQGSNTQRAVEQLRDLIFSGVLAGGSNHLETELAEMLGMSRTPVREAAVLLEAQGLLELQPRRGVRIQPVSVDDMREIYEVLTELESLAAANAAAAGYSDADLSGLDAAVTAMEESIEADDLETWAKADEMFHRELVRLGKNSRVVTIAAMMSDQVRRARQTTLHMRAMPSRSNEDHRAVLNAIRGGDAVEARRIHREHRERAKNEIIGLLEKYRILSL
ncbi:GntR family transcriptional regulator [Tropicimonas sediminicola]|uniref:Transcriptional regulator, GntR family n=1 Tax=Tropicimonas sediminicola TaxID=1031541 RepID=A0A239LL13_9RHOB|nr:GntR family transcriptional regulator [Tropicimonas sediminicola]SNT31357.1 transcriptional regulator, GntR family [Tropicimonas sediminicola]